MPKLSKWLKVAGLLLLSKLIARKTKPEHGNGLQWQVSIKLCEFPSASRFRLLAAVANNGHAARRVRGRSTRLYGYVNPLRGFEENNIVDQAD
jgi:hypothetical protein